MSPKLLNSKKRSIVSEIAKFNNEAKINAKEGNKTDKFTTKDFDFVLKFYNTLE